MRVNRSQKLEQRRRGRDLDFVVMDHYNQIVKADSAGGFRTNTETRVGSRAAKVRRRGHLLSGLNDGRAGEDSPCSVKVRNLISPVLVQVPVSTYPLSRCHSLQESVSVAYHSISFLILLIQI
jgi:hypothetical protein